MRWAVEVITHINQTHIVDADTEAEAFRAGEAAAAAVMASAGIPDRDVALIDVQGADRVVSASLGHRFAGDPDEAPRCVFCDARAGGAAASRPCEHVYPGFEEPSPSDVADVSGGSTWNIGSVEGPGD